jgi:uncharacterized protein (DUF1697 family)/ribosomal protein S18 acetylase RimI-like enzyme
VFFLAQIDGAAVGYARLRYGPAPACVPGARPVEIVRLYADRPCIGRGVGAALMTRCLYEAAARECGVVWLDVWERNPRAIAFYAKWGFEVVGEQDFLLGDDVQHDLLMARPAGGQAHGGQGGDRHVSHRYVALLRGVNVGRANRLAMADLLTVVRSLGYGAARTLLNSGNVVFSADEADPLEIATRLERALAETLGISTLVIVLSAEEFSAAVDGNPLLGLAGDASRLIVGFLRDGSDAGLLQPLTQQNWDPETFALGRSVTYAWCPGGVTGSPLLAAVTRAVGDSLTARNWATVLKIQTALTQGE